MLQRTYNISEKIVAHFVDLCLLLQITQDLRRYGL